MANFGSGTGRDHILEPILLGLLLARRDDFHLITAVERMGERDQLVVDLGSDATGSDLGVHAECKVERCGAFGQGEEIAIGRKDKDLLTVEVEFELVNEVQRIFLAALEHLSDLGQPGIEVVGSAARGIGRVIVFVAPMRGQPLLCNLIHPLGSDLHFDPFS